MNDKEQSKTITVQEYSDLTNKITEVIHKLLVHKNELSASTAVKSMLDAQEKVSELFRKGLSMNLNEDKEQELSE